jgi:hypothetical protein
MVAHFGNRRHFATLSGNVRYLRTPAIQSGTKRLILTNRKAACGRFPLLGLPGDSQDAGKGPQPGSLAASGRITRAASAFVVVFGRIADEAGKIDRRKGAPVAAYAGHKVAIDIDPPADDRRGGWTLRAGRALGPIWPTPSLPSRPGTPRAPSTPRSPRLATLMDS